MKKTSTQQKTAIIKYLGTINFRRIVRESRAIKPLVGYSLFFYLALGVVASPKANARAFCTLNSGKSAAIFNHLGQTIAIVNGPRDIDLEEEGDISPRIKVYRIYIRRDAWLTVYRIENTDYYIDINTFRNPFTCKQVSPQAGPNDIIRRPRNR